MQNRKRYTDVHYFLFLLGGLRIFFCCVLEFLSSCFCESVVRFLTCGYCEVPICLPITISTCFKLIVIKFQGIFRDLCFSLPSPTFCLDVDLDVLLYIFTLSLLVFNSYNHFYIFLICF